MEKFADLATDPPSNSSLSSSHRALDSNNNFLKTSQSASILRFLRLLHRLAVFGVAVWYVEISLHSFSTAVKILENSVSHDLPLQIHTTKLMAGYAGTTTILDGPLIQQVLKGDSSTRNDTIYLVTPWVHSNVGCWGVSNFDTEMYGNNYLRYIFSRLQTYASYNLSYVKELELIAPVVDCTFDYLVSGDTTLVRVYYLTRQATNSSKVLLLSTSLSAQDYMTDEQFQRGSAVILKVAAIEDMNTTGLNHHMAVAFNYPYVIEPVFEYSELEGTDKDNFWLLKTLANEQNQDPAKDVRMARRFGRYLSDPTSQSNIEIAHWDLPNTPAMEVSEWRWKGRTVLHDTWAWTHAIHGLFAASVIFNLLVLAFVIYRRLRMGHFWVGDAFATISNLLLYRGVIVLVCNHLNGYWTITKMSIAIGDTISKSYTIYYKPELVHADLLALYLNIVSVLSYLFRERLDPLVTFCTFELGWNHRVELAQLYPSLRTHIANFAIRDATSGLLEVSSGLGNLSPMDLLTAYGLGANRRPVVFSVVVSIFTPILAVVAYIIARKAIRYIEFSDGGGIRVGRRTSTTYLKDAAQTDPEQLTTFEVATGAALSKRFGVVSGYDNYVANGTRTMATIDAVYSNGFLVVNGKFLVGAQDLLPLLLMKVTRIRFTNIFVYEIIKDGVNQTAQLVYPTTISWTDLRNLDVSTLP